MPHSLLKGLLGSILWSVEPMRIDPIPGRAGNISGGRALSMLLALGERLFTAPNVLRVWALSDRTGIAGDPGGGTRILGDGEWVALIERFH